MIDRSVLDATADGLANELSTGSASSSWHRRCPSTGAASSARKSDSEARVTGTAPARLPASGPLHASQSTGALESVSSRHEKKRARVCKKWERLDELRKQDRRRISEKVEQQKQLRASRSQRLLEGVTSHDTVALQTAVEQRSAHEAKRRCDLYASWDEGVYQPLAAQAHEHLNPPDRLAQQALAGMKSVDFHLDEPFRLRASIEGDPVRRPLLDHAWEEAFHREASAVLQGTSGASASLATRAGAQCLPLRARSRPVLEPNIWEPVQLQGTLYGHFAQVAEQGPGFRTGRRGGSDRFVPNESDGVAAAGKKPIGAGPRAVLHNSTGILRGDLASRGEAAQCKTWAGASTGAPAQDHYTYETGLAVTDLEFPLGKRLFPEFR